MLLETIHHKKCAPKGNLQSQLSQIKLYSLKATLISNPPSIFNLQIWYQIKRWLSLYIPYSYMEKKRFASWVNEFRPADLLSNLYEIITKVLSNRFWKFHGRIYPHSWMLHGKRKNHASQGCANRLCGWPGGIWSMNQTCQRIFEFVSKCIIFNFEDIYDMYLFYFRTKGTLKWSSTNRKPKWDS